MLFSHEWEVAAKDTVNCSFGGPSKMQRNLLGKAKCLERRFSHLANHVLQRGGFPLVRTSCSHRRLRTPFKESQREKTRITIQEKDVHTESSTILFSLPTKHTHTPPENYYWHATHYVIMCMVNLSNNSQSNLFIHSLTYLSPIPSLIHHHNQLLVSCGAPARSFSLPDKDLPLSLSCEYEVIYLT